MGVAHLVGPYSLAVLILGVLDESEVVISLILAQFIRLPGRAGQSVVH